jgi:hypothetical protein
VIVAAGEPAADFVLADEGTIAGVVSRADGAPVSVAEVRVTLLAAPRPGAPLLAFRRVQTVRGAFRVPGLAAGAFFVEVQSRGEGVGRFQGSLAAGERRQVSWRLPGARPSGPRASESVVVGPE